MSRRNVSPLRTPGRTEIDPRDNIVRKLKEDLIVAKGREKQLIILENYILELIDKTKLLAAETAKADEQGRLKLELSLKTTNQLKKQVDTLRIEMRSCSNELRDAEAEEEQLKKVLGSKIIEIDKLKKDGVSLHSDQEKLVNEQYRLRTQEDDITHQIKKLTENLRDFDGRIDEISRKIVQAKSYINEMSIENGLLKDKLKNYEHQNCGMGSELQQKQSKIDDLEQVFAEKHEFIKNQVENYIQIEHQNQKNFKETKHKLNLLKIENQKYNELTNVLKKTEKTIGERNKQLSDIRDECDEIRNANREFSDMNNRMKQDLMACRQHLQNLIKHNAYIQQQMENYVKEDEAIIATIRKKRVLTPYNSLPESRKEGKNTERIYK